MRRETDYPPAKHTILPPQEAMKNIWLFRRICGEAEPRLSGQRSLAASFWSFAAERRAKRSLRSLRPGMPFPHSLPPRRWVAARSFFPSALSAGAGRTEKNVGVAGEGKASPVLAVYWV